MRKFQTLYKRDKKNNIQEWTLFVEKNGYYVIEGLENGKKTTSEVHTVEPKNVGKKNATNAEQQAEVEAEAKFNHKLAHGYSLTKAGVDSTGYEEPMLAKQYEDYEEDIEEDLWIDDKLNGVRCNSKGKLKMISRGNKEFHTIPHIIAELAPLHEKYPNLFIDGELFNPKLKERLNRLAELVSVAYQPKDLTPELLAESKEIVQFWVYDGFNFSVNEDVSVIGFPLFPKNTTVLASTPFPIRRAALHILLKDYKYVKVLGYFVIKNAKKTDKVSRAKVKKTIKELLEKVAKAKGEGIIIRYAPCPYEFKRSKYLLKAKNFIEEEFEIEDIQEGNADWVGCAKRIVLKLPKPVMGRDEKIQTNFASNIEGTREYLRDMFNNKEKYIGLMATCKFQNYSEYKIPQIPYVIAIRNYE